MRESIGGAWLFGIVITFIFLFSAFLAYSVSYTRAFNMKNEIINYIEQNEGFSRFDGDVHNANLKDDTTVEGKVFYLIKNSGYNYQVAETVACPLGAENMPGGYCLTKICSGDSDKSLTSYKVTTYIALSIPLINITVKIPISGETRTIYHDGGNYECSRIGDGIE